ncbi:hypothetical protein JTB14_001417 [Gonioctena quinquepunctata]|nr:hypothetical protein JTB14_001417 [Gonioctena quinquepunctata]
MPETRTKTTTSSMRTRSRIVGRHHVNKQELLLEEAGVLVCGVKHHPHRELVATFGGDDRVICDGRTTLLSPNALTTTPRHAVDRGMKPSSSQSERKLLSR